LGKQQVLTLLHLITNMPYKQFTPSYPQH